MATLRMRCQAWGKDGRRKVCWDSQKAQMARRVRELMERGFVMPGGNDGETSGGRCGGTLRSCKLGEAKLARPDAEKIGERLT